MAPWRLQGFPCLPPLLLFQPWSRQHRDGSAPPQRDSSSAPSPDPRDLCIQLSLSDEEKVGLAAEVDRLQQVLVIGKVVGSRPSKGELGDLLQGLLLVDVWKIVYVQTLGCGFYRVECEAKEAAGKVLRLSPLTLHLSRARYRRAHYRTWLHSCDLLADIASSFVPCEE